MFVVKKTVSVMTPGKPRYATGEGLFSGLSQDRCSEKRDRGCTEHSTPLPRKGMVKNSSLSRILHLFLLPQQLYGEQRMPLPQANNEHHYSLVSLSKKEPTYLRLWHPDNSLYFPMRGLSAKQQIYRRAACQRVEELLYSICMQG